MLLTINKHNCYLSLELYYVLHEKAAEHDKNCSKQNTVDSMDLRALTKTLLANVQNLRKLVQHQRLQSRTSNVEAVHNCDVIDLSSANGDEHTSTSVVSKFAARHRKPETASQQCKSTRQPQSVEVSGVHMVRYKTEICRQFDENGTCRYGDKCQFAHGRAEVRSLARHPKYKTELCRTFHSTGFCPYGLRCHFIHNDDEELHRNASRAAGGSQPTGISWTDITKLDYVTFRQSRADYELGTVVRDVS